jgi:hypothetical protein
MKLHGIAKTCPNSRRLIARRARARLDALLRPLFAHGPLSGKGVLTTTGRRTGKPRRHSVRAIRQRDRVLLGLDLRDPFVLVRQSPGESAGSVTTPTSRS